VELEVLIVLHSFYCVTVFLGGLVGRSTWGSTTSARGLYDEGVELVCIPARSSPSAPWGGSGFYCVTVFLGGLVGRSTFGSTTSARCMYEGVELVCFPARSSPSAPCGASGFIIGIFDLLTDIPYLRPTVW
jgi:hypothetical protein